MKRLILIVVIVLLVTGCASSLTEEAQVTSANYELRQNILDSIALMSEEATQESRLHHYDSFNEVVYESGGGRIVIEPTLEALDGFSQTVVRGRMGSDARIIYEGGLPSANTVSLEILEVFSGNPNVGETIRIIEPYFIHNGVLYTRWDYLPSIPYQEYIFFFSPQVPRSGEFDGAFWVSFGDRGRYPMPGDRTRASVMHYLGADGSFSAATQNFNSAVFGLGSRADVEIYASLWEEVMNEYVLPTLIGIELRPSEAVMTAGDTLELTTVILPVTDSVATWTSSNPSVTTVSSFGVVTAVRAGIATITATTTDGQEATSEILVVGDGDGMPGDVNGDGVVDFLDVLVLIYYLDNNGNISDDVTFIRENADLNGDGVIDDRDLEILFNFLDALG